MTFRTKPADKECDFKTVSQTKLLERKVPLVSAEGVMTNLCGNPAHFVSVPD